MENGIYDLDVDFLKNQILFGRDRTEGIVTVEFKAPSSILVYRRGKDGATEREEVAFEPFLWVSEDIGSCETLDGNLPYRFLRRCETWDAFTELRTELKKTGIACFGLSDPIQQYLISTGRTLFKGMEFESLRRLQLDIETCCAEGFSFSHADRDPIAAIALCDNTGWEEILVVEPNSEESERQVLERLTAIIAERDPDVIEGHNLFKFDLPYISTRAKRHKVKLNWGRDGSPIAGRTSRLLIAEKTIQYTRYEIEGRHIVDTFLLAQYYDVGTRELESFGLKNVARHFGVAEEDRVIIPGAQIQNAYLEDRERFITYALQDVRETRALAAVLSASYFIQAQIFPYNYQDVIVRGNATRIDSLFLREYLHRKHSIPECPESRAFEGGYTDIFFTGVKREVWHC
ncbi:MAG: 3'-5' exonuclease, partial [Chthoniobacterales bacterium]